MLLLFASASEPSRLCKTCSRPAVWCLYDGVPHARRHTHGAVPVQEKSLASQSWEDSRLGTLDSADEPSIGRMSATDLQNGNGNGEHRFSNGNGDAAAGGSQRDHSSGGATERHGEERRRHGEPLSTASMENESVDEMWQAGGEVAAHDAPAVAPKKAI